MPFGLPGSPTVRAKMMSWVAWCSPLFQRFIPLITHSSPSRTAVVSMYVASLPWFGSVSPNASRRVPSRKPGIHCGDLLGGAEVAHHQHGREVADDRRLVLQIVVQPEALGRQVLADDRHLEVRRVATAELGRQREAQPAGGVGAAAHLAQQLLPFGAWNAAVVEVGARPLPAVIEEAHVVVGLLQRLDLAFDELVELVEGRLDLGRNREVHESGRYESRRPPLPRSQGHKAETQHDA